MLDNLVREYAGTHYAWDEKGQLTERTQNGRKTRFTWDGFGRMTSATTEQGTTHYRYDPLGRRIGKRRADGSEVLFGWDGDTLAYESSTHALAKGGHAGTHNAHAQDGSGSGHTIHYIHEKDSFVPLLQAVRGAPMRLPRSTDVKALMAASGGAYDIDQDPIWNGQALAEANARNFEVEEICYYQCDHLGTPQELTNHDGELAWSAQYKAWGQAKEVISAAAAKAGIRNPIRFQGQYLDDETGLHYNRYRYYDVSFGRYISEDPIGLIGGLNLQSYGDDPVQWVDPLGLNKARGITPNNKGARTTISGGAGMPRETTGYSRKAGGSGASHPVVKDLYDQVPADLRSPFHGDCGEADALSKIASDHNVKSIDELKNITIGGTVETTRNDGKHLPCCSSCNLATRKIGINQKVQK